jgi:hypothetical protein
VSRWRRVIGVGFFSSVGLPVLSTPVMSVKDSSSGMCLYTESSRDTRPRSTSLVMVSGREGKGGRQGGNTHCMQQTEVMSLVKDATHMTVSSWKALAFSGFMEVWPKALAYVTEPDLY